MTKLAIITGGSRGIGRELVLSFARAGYAVGFGHVAGEDTAAAEVVSSVERAGGRAMGFAADVGEGAEVERFFDAVGDWAGTAAEVLVNNAGIQTWSSLLDLSEDDWNRVIRTNLTGCFLNTKAAARRMIAAGLPGSIINIGSGCNKLGFPKLVDYTASKGGIEQFSKVSAVELGPYGIRVNCVAPGAIVTERTLEEAPDYEQTWAAITPLRRAGRPADIVGPVLFLAGDTASFVTGQTIWVDGGVFTQAPWPYPT